LYACESNRNAKRVFTINNTLATHLRHAPRRRRPPSQRARHWRTPGGPGAGSSTVSLSACAASSPCPGVSVSGSWVLDNMSGGRDVANKTASRHPSSPHREGPQQDCHGPMHAFLSSLLSDNALVRPPRQIGLRECIWSQALPQRRMTNAPLPPHVGGPRSEQRRPRRRR
jgi:hypothetical protein